MLQGRNSRRHTQAVSEVDIIQESSMLETQGVCIDGRVIQEGIQV